MSAQQVWCVLQETALLKGWGEASKGGGLAGSGRHVCGHPV